MEKKVKCGIKSQVLPVELTLTKTVNMTAFHLLTYNFWAGTFLLNVENGEGT